MRRIIAGCIFLIAASKLSAQEPGVLPVIIPPSPDIAAIANKTTLSASMFTGAATVNIPLYTIRAGSLEIPVGLNYSSNGIRVNDISGRAGLGWNLIAGGTISKIIHDEDDDDPQTIRLSDPNFYNQDLALVDYAKKSILESYDTEYDEYSYNAGNLSGKFFIDGAGVINMAARTDVKIERSPAGFIITTGDGIKYHFISEKETTKDVKISGTVPSNKEKTTAWFLTKITSPEGDAIYFHYNSIQTKAFLGQSQTVILKAKLPVYTADPSEVVNCGACASGNLGGIKDNEIEYLTYYLSYISTSNGQAVYFIYEPRPQPESSKDNRLSGINIWETYTNKLIKKYRMEYDDYFIPGDVNQRFYLKKIHEDSKDSPASEDLVHSFDYINREGLPSQKSLNQDYYGYANAAHNIDYFFPLIDDYADYHFGDFGADRTPDLVASQSGILQKVTFPTGGYQSFEYEPHIITISDSISDFTHLSDPGMNFIAGTSLWSPATVVTRDIYLTSPDISFQFLTNVNPAGPDEGQPGYYPPDNVHPLTMLKIYDLATNTMVFNATHFYRSTQIYNLSLPVNKTYRIEMKAYSYSHALSVWVDYNPAISTTYTNINGSGLRVKKLTSFDPATNKSLNKRYYYSSLQDLCAFKGLSVSGADPISPLAVLKSSAVGKLQPQNGMQYIQGGICPPRPGFIEPWQIEACTNMIQVSSGSLVNQFLYNGSPIAYTSVIEAEEEDITRGCIEHRFYTGYIANPVSILGIYANIPEGVHESLNGSETYNAVYKYNNSSLTLLNETLNEYYTGTYNSLVNFTTRMRWAPPTTDYGGLITPSMQLEGFDIGRYTHDVQWNYLQKSTSANYDENGLNPVVTATEYTYDNLVNYKPTHIQSTTSVDGSLIEKSFKYPNDFATTVYANMVADHIINPVIEETTKKNNSDVTVVTNEYDAWPSATAFFYKPRTIKVKKGSAAAEERLRFYAYDIYGNPRELSKVNDFHLSYLWNYNNTYPVAEVKNAEITDIAYTGFEGDDQGNWTFLSTGVNQTAFTGTKGFTGTLTRTINPATSYEVTLWTSSSATVNSAAGTLVNTAGTWSLYKWLISSSSVVTVAGTDIDDVRLYPATAEMTTSTYNPFIGKTSETGTDGKVNYYEYDASNRLRLVMDKDKNILKKICYQYVGQETDCEMVINTTPYWYPSGRSRCLPCPQNNAYMSNLKETEQIDINPYSPTSGATIWVTAVNDECQPLADWVTSRPPSCEYIDEETGYSGYQLTEQTDHNPCSPTYNETRTIRLYRPELCYNTPPDSCSSNGPQYKLINGVCETGIRKNLSSVLILKKWHCTYIYQWSNCSRSPEYVSVEDFGSPCTLSLACTEL